MKLFRRPNFIEIFSMKLVLVPKVSSILLFGSCVVLWSFWLKLYLHQACFCFGCVSFGLLAMPRTLISSAILGLVEGALARIAEIDVDADGSSILTIHIGRIVISCLVINVSRETSAESDPVRSLPLDLIEPATTEASFDATSGSPSTRPAATRASVIGRPYGRSVDYHPPGRRVVGKYD